MHLEIAVQSLQLLYLAVIFVAFEPFGLDKTIEAGNIPA